MTLKQEFEKKVKELKESNWETENPVDFGYRMLGSSAFIETVTDWGNVWQWIEEKLKEASLDSMNKMPHPVRIENSDNKAIDDCVGVVERLVRLHSNDDSDYSVGASDVAYAILKSLEQLKEKKWYIKTY